MSICIFKSTLKLTHFFDLHEHSINTGSIHTNTNKYLRLNKVVNVKKA
jgi:hypothetical protein